MAAFDSYPSGGDWCQEYIGQFSAFNNDSLVTLKFTFKNSNFIFDSLYYICLTKSKKYSTFQSDSNTSIIIISDCVNTSQPVFTCSKLTLEKLKKGVKFGQS